MAQDETTRQQMPSSNGNKSIGSVIGSYRLGYRADIEGLRALAILLVVGNHAGVTWLSGGFIGVDIFFVLSGYLITGLLIQEIRAKQKINLAEFFARRIKRLLPALLFMIVCVSVAAAVILPPFVQTDQADTARNASIWISNIVFAHTNLEYFSPSSDTNLYLHTWSLGVEEQFYLIWPFLLLFFLGHYQHTAKGLNFSQLRYGLFATLFICLALSIFLSVIQPLWGFYLMPARAWQFALGAIVMLWKTSDGITLMNSPNTNPAGKHLQLTAIASWLGLLMIFFTAVLLNQQSIYPGVWALLPSVGTALILLSGTSNHFPSANHVLAHGGMQKIGRISYSWYLWHWPFLVLGNAMFQAEDSTIQGIIIALSLIMAIFSYTFIEAPIRKSATTARPAVVLGTAALFMSVSVSASSGWHAQAVTWTQKPQIQHYLTIREEFPVIYSMGCDDWVHSARVNFCIFGDQHAENTAVLIGDSIIGQWFPAFLGAFDTQGWRVLVLTKSSCPMVDEPWFYDLIGMEYTVCSQWRDNVLTELKAIQPDIILMGSSATYNFNKSQWTMGTQRILDEMSPYAGNIFIMRATHALGFDGPGCLAGRYWRPAFLTWDKGCSAKAGSAREDKIHQWLKDSARHYRNVSVLDMNPLVCPKGLCTAELDGIIVFRDEFHLSVRFVQSLSAALAHQLRVHASKDAFSLLPPDTSSLANAQENR